uniref:Uncharacterized protein n=1 Tax=Salix viminalis TaxID=40686 RepID=A0A6N2KZD8_SALVM
MLLFLLELALGIMLVAGASLLLMNMDALYMEMFLGFRYKISPTMRRSQLTRPSIGVLEEKQEKIAAGTLLGTTHTYVVNTGTQDKGAAKRVDLLRGQKTDRVDVTLLPEELEVMDNVLPSKYEEAREEEKLRSQREDFSDMVAENEKKRKRKMQDKDGKSKKKDFKF